MNTVLGKQNTELLTCNNQRHNGQVFLTWQSLKNYAGIIGCTEGLWQTRRVKTRREGKKQE